MNKSEKLRGIILSRYKSIREFAKIANIPNSTIVSALDRGIGGIAVEKMIVICDLLEIDIKTLEPVAPYSLSQTDITLFEKLKKLDDTDKYKVIGYIDATLNQTKYTRIIL